MTMLEDYLRRVQELLSSVASVLTAEEQGEVMHLIDHDEPAEAVRTLAWIIVDECKRVPASVIVSIKELTAGFVEENDLPGNLENFAVDSTPQQERDR